MKENYRPSAARYHAIVLFFSVSNSNLLVKILVGKNISEMTFFSQVGPITQSFSILPHGIFSLDTLYTLDQVKFLSNSAQIRLLWRHSSEPVS